MGTCLVNVNGDDNYLFGNLVPLDAGPSFIVKGPGGSMTVAANPGQIKTTLSAAGTFLVPGTYTISGIGGKDVGPFSATITIAAPPTLVSPLSANNLTVTRSNGMTVTWSGGDPNGHAEIELVSAIDSSFNNAALAYCKAPGLEPFGVLVSASASLRSARRPSRSREVTSRRRRRPGVERGAASPRTLSTGPEGTAYTLPFNP